jgi:hypothetical protein
MRRRPHYLSPVTRPTRVALASYAQLPELNADDRLLLAALRAAGASAEPVVWDTPCDWARFDVVVVRSCWDYHRRWVEFLAWIERVIAAGARLVNPAPVLRWNGDKRYLGELAAAGVRVVPTVRVEAAAPGQPAPSLGDVLRARGWDEAVVKPAVSASAHATWRTALDLAPRDEARFAALLAAASRGVLVQPFVEEVVADGEWSLVFLGGRFSHAVHKRSAAGDFRVQAEFGGRAEAAVPPQALTADAGAALAAATWAAGVPCDAIAYARVDGVARAGRLLLMELECIEPQLYFRTAAGTAARLAELVLRGGRAASAGLTTAGS